jgi:hypothetical protein
MVTRDRSDGDNSHHFDLPTLRALAPVVGFLIGCGLAQSLIAFSQWQASRDWRAIQSPPERPQKLLAVGDGGIYVETASAWTYFCQGGHAAGRPCLQVSGEPIREAPACDFEERRRVPKPPGAVVDSLELRTCNEEATFQEAYVLLADGSIWYWSFEWNGLEQTFFGIFTVVAALAGAVLVPTALRCGFS